MSAMTAVVLQARLDSTRLPNKAMLPLGGEPLVFRVMEALKAVACDLHVLACPPECGAVFAPLAQRLGFEVSAGSKDDVLARYCAAIRKFGIDRVIRATGDNPFVFADAAVAINREACSLNADYAGYSGLVYGAGVESVSAEALVHAEAEAGQQQEREHVCPYLYTHPEKFRLHRPLAPLAWQYPEMRVTVDTAEDYGRAQALYAALDGAPHVHPQDRYTGEAVIRTYRRIFPRTAQETAQTP